MTLTSEAALNKDKRTALAPLQHRHFATIAAIISELDQSIRRTIAYEFADRLIETNPKFDHERFMNACKGGA